MPKVQFIDPSVARKAGEITFQPIPVNQYNKTIQEEKKNFSTDELIRIYHDMVVIREFETMLNLIKTTGEYSGVPYDHPGPAHLSIGQEASAVGMAYTLTVDDFIFGSHRSHGEILAKGLSSIQKLDDAQLMGIMETFFDGSILKIVQKDFKGSVKELGRKFLIYGTLAEIFAREYLELFNPGTDPVNLKNWILMLGSKQKIFPDVVIVPDGYLLVTGTG